MGADWQTLAVIHVLVGYEADFLGMLPFRGEGNVKAEATRGLLISGFIFYTVVALIVALERFAELKGPEKVLKIVNVILLILAGLLLLAGVGVAGKHVDPYTGSLEAVAGLLALIGAVFLIISLVTGTKTSPS